jgi:general secretion pathway protein A
MFLDYYHLREQPFGVTPNPRYLYLSRVHREALATLYCGVEAGRGFMALIAEPGMGKTTLLMQLLERLRKSAIVVFLFQTQCNSLELLRYLLADLGLASGEQDAVNLHAQLNQALIRMSRAGRRFVLVIDEAQNLDSSVLETIRLLSDFETPSSKLIQIILSGQPQLADKLADPSLVQLRQRISILARLEPFSPEETEQYIEHRLRVAGHDGRRIFTSGATEVIAAESQGIPRNINNLCFNALSLGCALKRWKIDQEIVLEAVRDLELEALGHTPHSAQTHAPPAPAAEPRNNPRSARQRGLGQGHLGSAALGAAFFLMFLLLFPSVREVCRTPFTRAFATTLAAAKPIQRYLPSVLLSVSTGRQVSKGALADRPSGAVAATGHPNVTVEVKPWRTFYRICAESFRRFDSELTQQIRDLMHQGTGQKIAISGGARTSTGSYSVGHGESETMASKRNQP